MSSFQILTIFCFPLSCHCWVYFTSQHQFGTKKPIVLSHYIHNVSCTQKEKLYRIVVTVLVKREVCKMDWNQVGDVTPEEAATFNSSQWLGLEVPHHRLERRAAIEPGTQRLRLRFKSSSVGLHVTFFYHTKADEMITKRPSEISLTSKQSSWLFSNPLSRLNRKWPQWLPALEKKKSFWFDKVPLLPSSGSHDSLLLCR